MARRALVGFVASGALCIALVGCGAAATPTPSASSAAELPSQAAPSVAAPSAAEPSATESSAAAPSTGTQPSFSLPSDAKDLEALLPDSLCGGKSIKTSMNGTTLGSAGQSDLVKALAALGKSATDITLAIAIEPTSNCTAGILRIKGVDTSLLQSAMMAAAAQSGTTATQTTVGGKTVYKDAGTDSTTYVYFSGDSVIFASAKKDSDAASIVQSLP
jgi:hypothetical protein